MPVFKIYHTTTYEYDRLVKESVNQIRIFPFQSSDQEVLQHDLIITTDPEIHTFNDYWNNKVGVFNLLAPHKELVVESRLLVRTTPTTQLLINFHTGFDSLETETSNDLKMLELMHPEKVEASEDLKAIIQSIPKNANSVAATVEAYCEYIYKYFKYVKGITNVETTIDEILSHRSGVCQDFVHLMLQLLRMIKIPCRYVSGYICPNKNGMRGEGATHAWVEAWIPGYGWAGIDPTNNVWVTNKHVKLAVGRNFNDCSPVKGSFKGPAKQKLSVYVSVSYEDGHKFEERNNVRMSADEQDNKPPDLEDAEVQQQQ